MDTANLATKTDLKTAIKDLRKDLKTDIKVLRKDTLRLEERVESVEEKIDSVGQKLDKITNTLDAFVGTVDNLRTDNIVGAQHTRELQIKVDDLDKRVKSIESSRAAV